VFNNNRKLDISEYLATGKRQPPKEIKNVFIEKKKWNLALEHAKVCGCPPQRLAQRCMDFAIDEIIEQMNSEG